MTNNAVAHANESSCAASWRPLLPPPLAARAESVLEEIVSALLEPPERLPNLDLGALSLSLCNGTAGIALALGHLAGRRPGRGLEEAAITCLERALEGCASGPVQPSLFNGFVGVGWVLEYLDGRVLVAEQDLNGELEAALGTLLARSPWRAPVELVEGLAGLGLFALQRHARHGSAVLLASVLDRLEECAIRDARGSRWFTPPELLPVSLAGAAPRGRFDLGVAHGVPGVLGLLAALHRTGLERERCAALLESGMAWLLAQRIDGETESCFPQAVGPGVAPVLARTSWCYGDLGTAPVVFAAARALERDDWHAAAIELGRRAARRGHARSGAIDACLCHGSAGNAHLFNRLYQATGEEDFAEAALGWYERLLSEYREGQGFAGYRVWSGDGSGRQGWSEVPGFLLGSAGIALVLAAALDDEEPSWDRLLLADVSPGPLPARGVR